MAPTPTRKKQSALLRYALRNVASSPSGRPNTRKGPGGISMRPSATGGARRHLQAPGTALGAYANRLVAPGQRLPSRYYRGQADATAGLFSPRPPDGGGGGGGSWFQNLGKDFMSVIHGVPGTLSLAGRTLASAPVGSYGYTAGLVLPGGAGAREFTSDVGRDWVTAGKATAADFAYRYGPAFGGDWDTFAKRVKEHPGFFALDAASVASLGAAGAAKGASVGAKVGKGMTTARHARQAAGKVPFPANAPPPGWSSSILRATTSAPGGIIRRDPKGRPLAQQPRRGAATPDNIQLLHPDTRRLVPQPAPKGGGAAQPAGKSTGQLAPGLAERLLTSPKLRSLAESRTLARRTRTRKLGPSDVSVALGDGATMKLQLPTREVKLRPYSPNVMTRQMQKAWDERVMGALESFANKRGKKAGGRDRRFSTEARDARVLKRETRMIQRRHENRRDQGVHELTRDFQSKVLYNRKFTKDPRSEALLALRVDNVAVDKPGRSALQGVEQYLATQERRLADDLAKGMTDDQVAAHRANIDLVRSIPAEMIANPPKHILEGEEAARRMLTGAQDVRETQAGGRYGISMETRARADLYREAVQTGQAEWFDDVGGLINPEQRARLIKEGYQNVPLGDLVQAARHRITGGLGQRRPSPQAALAVDDMVKRGVIPDGPGGTWMLKGSRLHDHLAQVWQREHRGRVPLNSRGEIDASAMKAQMARDKLLHDRVMDPTNLFRPGERPAGGGTYRASTPVGYAGGHKKGSPSTNALGESGGVIHQTKGHFMGRDSLSRESLFKTVTQSLNAMHTQAQVRETVQRFALREAGDTKPMAIRSVDAAQALDAERWSLVSVRELERMVDELGSAQAMGREVKSFDSFANREQILRNLHKGDDSVVALPKPLVEEIKQAVDRPHELMRKYDKALDIWRAGILAYTPRWFINNLVGTTIFLGVLSGLDVRAFIQASRKSRFYKDHAIPFEAESVSHSYAIGADDIGRGGLEAAGTGFDRSAFMRGAHRMFLLNQRLEGRLRRAAYIAMAKQNLRNEGRLRGRSPLRSLSDDELFDAIVRMPDPLKEQTLRDMEFFVGQFKSYGSVEKRYLRRIIPFFSWLRVINTWAFGLPFKSPIRAEAVRIATTMGYALQDETEGLPLWEKGRLRFGNLALRTNNINPLYSVAEEIAGATGAENPGQAATDLFRVAGGSMSPPLQIAVGQIAGRNPFGTRDFTTPVGYGGTSNMYGVGQMRRNPVTGEIEYTKPSPPVWEQAFDQLIPFAGPIKTALAGQRQPYDSSSLLDLAGEKLGLRSEADTYQPPAKTPTGRGRLPAGLSPLSGLLGAPMYTVDREQERLATALSELRYSEAERDTARLRLREALRRQLGGR